MALSNWDTLAFNNKGESCVGTFRHKNGNWLEIYKNWAYLTSPSMWKKTKVGFRKPILASIEHGKINALGFNVQVARGDTQSACFVFASYYDKKNTVLFGGIGCYGYADRVLKVLSKLGRQEEYSEEWMDGSGNTSGIAGGSWVHFIVNCETKEKIVYHDKSKDGEYDYGADWEGVREDTVAAFFKWIREEVLLGHDCDHDKEILTRLAKCETAKTLRYNQGDAFLAGKFGVEIPATKIGESDESFLSQALNKTAKKDKAE